MPLYQNRFIPPMPKLEKEEPKPKPNSFSVKGKRRVFKPDLRKFNALREERMTVLAKEADDREYQASLDAARFEVELFKDGVREQRIAEEGRRHAEHETFMRMSKEAQELPLL